uniref:PLA2c domain-containing protein n=1 Tax=Xiphophorus couchianus TaxID=32473 RepID=A0A3B5M2I0_9TELE
SPVMNCLQETIRHSSALCAGEQQYIDRRKEIVLQALNNLQINCNADLVPHIALVASGGGQRAAVSLIGFLYQLEKEAMLDTLLYIGGVSGSTWSMAFLYNDPQWSSNMDEAVSKLSGPGVELEHAVAWLTEKSKEEDFSLTDIWGVLTSAGQQERHQPLPRLLVAVKGFLCSLGKWFEVSPHEAGFTELNLFVETSLLGSKFHNGELMEKKPEMDMISLQGELHNHCAIYPNSTVVTMPIYTIPQLQRAIWMTKEEFHLIDAGLLINMAYPSFLGEKRDIDLIIAPESSAGIMFEVNYAAEVNKPFPPIDNKILEESDWPKNCYVFEGKEKEPTIIYMPLFNQQNCKGLISKMKEFSTFTLPFSQEKINFLLETAKTNMKNNREIVLRELRKAALRRMRKMSV